MIFFFWKKTCQQNLKLLRNGQITICLIYLLVVEGHPQWHQISTLGFLYVKPFELSPQPHCLYNTLSNFHVSCWVSGLESHKLQGDRVMSLLIWWCNLLVPLKQKWGSER